MAQPEQPENTLNRRQALRGFFGLSGSIALLSWNLSIAARAVFSKVQDFSGPEKNYEYTDERHTYSRGGVIRNLGVFHTTEKFEEKKGHILEAVDECEILCMEEGDYFDVLDQYARDQGKKTLCVDGQGLRPSLTEAGLGLTSVGTAIFLACKHKDMQGDDLQKRRRWLKLAALSLVTSFAMPKAHPSVDFSYLTDARSVIMAASVLNISEQYSQKKILFVSGNGHAQDFEYYIRHTDFLRLKETLYGQIYGMYAKSELSEE